MEDVLSLYSECTLCPNLCRVDRRERTGICRQGDKVRLAWAGLHRGEEPPITGEHGSGMLFFTGCPLHCRYCQNRQISGSDGLDYGIDVSIRELSDLMLSLEGMGARTLNLVTGTHFIPSIIKALDIAKSEGLTLPVVWNSSGFERVEALALIDPYIDVYLLDCKTLDRNVSKVYCGGAKYVPSILPVLDYVKLTHPYTDLDALKGTILRHLVFPGTLNATRKFLRVFAERYKDAFFLSLMTQFVPPLGDLSFSPLTEEECDSLVYLMEELGIEDGFMQDPGDDDVLWIPDFRRDRPFPESFSDPDPLFLSLKHRSGSR